MQLCEDEVCLNHKKEKDEQGGRRLWLWMVFRHSGKGFLQGVCTEVDGEKCFFRKESELLNAVGRDMYVCI